MSYRAKKFVYKVYKYTETLWDVAFWDVDVWDSTYVYNTSWTPKEILNPPAFREIINTGACELVIRLARPFNNFGEEEDVALGNLIDLYVYDHDAPDGIKKFRGKISAYRPVFEQKKEFVEITVLGLAAEFENYILRDSSDNTTLAYNSVDPSTILRNVLDKYRADGGYINYTSTSIDNTNTTVSYTFSLNTIKECIDKIAELAPDGWYGYVDNDGIYQFHGANLANADYKVAIGREVERMEASKTTEQIINRIYAVGGTPAGDTQLYEVFEATGSIGTYGLYAKKLVDGRVTLPDTLSIMASRKLSHYQAPITRTTIEIVDNSGHNSGHGADIESFNVGKTIQIQNLGYGYSAPILWDLAVWDVDVWDQPLNLTVSNVMQITSIKYELDKISIEASDRLPEVSKRIEDIKRNLEQEQTKDIPTSPS